jgi:hypothetical protein
MNVSKSSHDGEKLPLFVQNFSKEKTPSLSQIRESYRQYKRALQDVTDFLRSSLIHEEFEEIRQVVEPMSYPVFFDAVSKMSLKKFSFLLDSLTPGYQNQIRELISEVNQHGT